jgi:hypothetical protein
MQGPSHLLLHCLSALTASGTLRRDLTSRNEQRPSLEARLVNKLLAFYVIRRFVTELKGACPKHQSSPYSLKF